MKKLLLMISLFSCLACGNSQHKQEIKTWLHEKYGEDFRVYNVSYAIGPDGRKFKAKLLADTNVIISGRCHEKGIIDDTYLRMSLNKQMVEKVKELFELDTPRDIAIESLISLDENIIRNQRVTALENVFKIDSLTGFVTLNIYIFHSINHENKHLYLKGVQNLFSYFGSIHKKIDFGFTVYFWDESFWDDFNYDPEQVIYGFGSTLWDNNLEKDINVDSDEVLNKYCKKEIGFDFMGPKKYHFTIDELYDYLHENDKYIYLGIDLDKESIHQGEKE